MASWSARLEERVDVAVPGRDDAVPCLVRVGSALTGGAGAGTSATGASIPKGPSGPIESSRLSSVVDWARLTCRRGALDFEGASLPPVLDVGEDGESCAGFEGVVSALLLSSSAALGRLMLDDDREGTSDMQLVQMERNDCWRCCTVPW